ncbi:unnamed protein product [Cyprideis torosa]|uniref:DNA polymerase delta subunit 3 n=1 Tax=Cyprideis torosa TaxID=163714 RepID=A0A7R8WN52_9CRUS|nr:unnamed protein product [Cyprideis torosa]CAG0899179.1 unnamed protein product [Cyprideis torosa]
MPETVSELSQKEIDSMLESVEEILKDRGELVTVKTISKELQIPVNISKSLLATYVSKHGKADSSLRAVYLATVSVLPSGNGESRVSAPTAPGLKVMLIGQKKLNQILASPEKFGQVLSYHVYALSRVALKDSDAIYLTEKGVTVAGIEPPPGITRVLRSTQSLPATKTKEGPPPPLTTKSASTPVETQQKPVSARHPAEKARHPAEKARHPALAASTGKKPAFSSAACASAFNKMFQNAAAHKPGSGKGVAQSEEKTTTSSANKKEEPEAKKGGARSSSQSQKSSSPPPSQSVAARLRRSPRKQDGGDSQSKKAKTEQKKAPSVRTASGKRPRVSSQSSSEDEGKGRSQGTRSKKKEAPPSSRKKDEAMEELQERERALSPPPEMVVEDSDPELEEKQDLKDPSTKTHRHRVKKWVDKTWVDQDGFLVTKKEMVSCSEESEEEKEAAPPAADGKAEPAEKKATPSAPAKGKTPPVATGKTKQPSILGFFKKKTA